MKRLLFFAIVFAAFTNKYFAQNLLINPTAEGGFELAGGFAGNGWTVVNSTINTWNVGSTAVPFAGTNSAFISSTSGVSYDYDPTVLQTSHFYRDVTVPAGNTAIQLKFQYKNVGEQFLDRLLIFAAPTSVTPVANDPFANAIPNDQITGATLVYMDPAQQSSYVQRSVFLPSSLAGTTFRLIFTWQNDASSAPVNPASIDDIYLYSQPLAPLNGIYTLNNQSPTSSNLPVSGSNFTSFTDAINYLNVHGVSGSVTFNVSAGQTFTESSQIITGTGTNLNRIVFQKIGSGNNPVFVGVNGLNSADAAFTFRGADYITFDGIDVTTNLTLNNNQQMEFAYYFTNVSATDGSNHNTIKNSKVSLNRANTSTIAVFQNMSVTPSAASGANVANKLNKVQIENSFLGIYFLGSTLAGLQDDSCEVVDCVIGGTSNFDIGGGLTANQTAGIWLANQKNSVVRGNTVRNVGNMAVVHGIFMDRCYNVTEVSFNKIYKITNTSTASTSVVSGIRVNFPTTGSSFLAKVYNNFISSIRSNYAGLPNTARIIRGINLQFGGSSNTTCVFEVSHNSVSIDGSSSINCSSTCFETGASNSTGPVLKFRNNILSNFTATQTGNAKHFCLRMPSATNFGSTGSGSNNNDFYIADPNNGFVANGNTTDYPALSNWQTTYGQDANSISVDPIFVSADDLHAVNPALNSAAAINTLLPYITTDIDGETRTLPNSDIGADEFNVYLFDVKPLALLQPPTTGCYSSSQPVSIQLMNYTGNPIDFSFNPVTVTVATSGAFAQTISFTISDNSLNGNNPLPAFTALNVPVGNINMSAYGNYNFTVYTTWNADQNLANDTIKNILRFNTAPSSLPQQVDFTNYTGINLGILFPGWSEASGNTPVGTTSQWQFWNDFGSVGNVNARLTLDGNTKKEWILGPKIIPAANSILSYKSAVTAVASVNNAPASLGADDKLYVMISTDCGISFQKVDSLTASSVITNSFNQYFYSLFPYAGQEIIVAFMATDGALVDGNCDLHLEDINIQSSTAYDLSVTSFVSPLFEYCYSNNEQIVINLQNAGPVPIDFTTDNATLYVNVSGQTSSAYSLNLNSGLFMPGATQTYTLTNSFDLSQSGVYHLQAYASISSGDVNTLNDTLEMIVYSQNPSVDFSSTLLTICAGDSVLLTPQVQVNGFGPSTLPAFSSNHSPLNIPDLDTAGVRSTITVNGVGGLASQVLSVVIDSIVHTYAGDLVLTLTAPNGSSMILSSNLGGSSDNYIQTVFESSASASVLTGSAPFTGSYRPQQGFNLLSGNANGVWTLKVEDNSSGDVGTLNKWSLNFRGANGVQSFTWTNASSLNSASSLNPTASPLVTETFVLSITDSNACVALDSVEVLVNNLPQVVLTAPNDTVCSASGLMVLNASPNGGQFSGNGVDANGNFDPSVSGSGTQQVIYSITDVNSCSNSDTLQIQVNTSPQVSLSLSQNFLCVYDAAITLGGESPAGGIFSGVGVNGSSFDPSLAGLGTQTITYSYTDLNSCSGSASDTIQVSDCVGIAEWSAETIKIFPIPANDFIEVDGLGSINSMELLDFSGKLVWSKKHPSMSERISLTELSEGVYFLKFNSAIGITILKRFIKE